MLLLLFIGWTAGLLWLAARGERFEADDSTAPRWVLAAVLLTAVIVYFWTLFPLAGLAEAFPIDDAGAAVANQQIADNLIITVPQDELRGWILIQSHPVAERSQSAGEHRHATAQRRRIAQRPEGNPELFLLRGEDNSAGQLREPRPWADARLVTVPQLGPGRAAGKKQCQNNDRRLKASVHSYTSPNPTMLHLDRQKVNSEHNGKGLSRTPFCPKMHRTRALVRRFR